MRPLTEQEEGAAIRKLVGYTRMLAQELERVIGRANDVAVRRALPETDTYALSRFLDHAREAHRSMEQALEYVRGDEAGEAIQVWSFYDAPLDLQALSTNGGDEDWIAVVPKHILQDWPWIVWLEEPNFGPGVDRIDLPDGRIVFIASHA